MRRVAFIDRDGTINEEKIYLSHPDDFYLLPGVGEAIKQLNKADWAVVVVTNQSALARGYLSEETLGVIHQKMERLLAEAGAMIDGIYICPHHPDEACACRKPRPGLFKQAAADLSLDLSQAVFVGDKMSDLGAGHQLGCPTILVLTGHGQEHWQQRATWSFQPNAVLPNLTAAVDWILANFPEIEV